MDLIEAKTIAVSLRQTIPSNRENMLGELAEQVSKVYTGWVLLIDGKEETVIGSVVIRGSHSYVLKGANGKTSISRDVLLKRMNAGSIKYMRSVKV